MIFREATAYDRGAVRALVEAAFGQRGEADLVDRLEEDGVAMLHVLADDAGRIVGQAMFHKIDGAGPGWVSLAPMSVLPGWQRQGIGTLLLRNALAILQGRGVAGGLQDALAIFLICQPANNVAIAFEEIVVRKILTPLPKNLLKFVIYGNAGEVTHLMKNQFDRRAGVVVKFVALEFGANPGLDAQFFAQFAGEGLRR